jgi:hypothetical protein
MNLTSRAMPKIKDQPRKNIENCYQSKNARQMVLKENNE